MAGMMIAVVLVSLIAFGFSLHERYAQPDYRPVAKHLNQNAGDAPVVHLSLETFKYVGIYHDDLVDQRWRPLWLASRPELRGSIIDAGGELFVVIESVLIDELYNGSAQDFLAQIMKSSWEVVDTTDLGAYTVYRIKKPKKNYPFEMGAT